MPTKRERELADENERLKREIAELREAFINLAKAHPTYQMPIFVPIIAPPVPQYVPQPVYPPSMPYPYTVWCGEIGSGSTSFDSTPTFIGRN